MSLSSRSVPAQAGFYCRFDFFYRQGVDLGVEQIHAAVNIAYRRAQFVRHSQQVDLAHVLVSRHFIGDTLTRTSRWFSSPAGEGSTSTRSQKARAVSVSG